MPRVRVCFFQLSSAVRKVQAIRRAAATMLGMALGWTLQEIFTSRARPAPVAFPPLAHLWRRRIARVAAERAPALFPSLRPAATIYFSLRDFLHSSIRQSAYRRQELPTSLPAASAFTNFLLTVNCCSQRNSAVAIDRTLAASLTMSLAMFT